jgi:hypothetical protein
VNEMEALHSPETAMVYMVERITEIEKRLDRLMTRLGIRETFGIPDIAALGPYAESTLYKADKPWLLPRWGVSDFPGKRRWTKETVDEYVSKTPAEWKEIWDAMSTDERRTAIGFEDDGEVPA